MFHAGEKILDRQRFQFPANWVYVEHVDGEWGAFSEILKRKDSAVQAQVRERDCVCVLVCECEREGETVAMRIPNLESSRILLHHKNSSSLLLPPDWQSPDEDHR